MKLLTSFLLLCLTLSCNMRQSSHSENSLSSDTIRYAQGFTVHHFDGYTAVEVRDPWDSTRLLQRYLLVDRDRPVPENLPKGTVVQVPAQNVVVYTSVHAAIIDQLGETGRIIGVCEPRYMDTPAIREGLKAGRIAEGYLADLCLVDLDIPAFTPNHNFVSNLVYAANGSCIDTVICNGKILMQDKKVPGEEEIMEHTAELAYKLVREP